MRRDAQQVSPAHANVSISICGQPAGAERERERESSESNNKQLWNGCRNPFGKLKLFCAASAKVIRVSALRGRQFGGHHQAQCAFTTKLAGQFARAASTHTHSARL